MKLRVLINRKTCIGLFASILAVLFSPLTYSEVLSCSGSIVELNVSPKLSKKSKAMGALLLTGGGYSAAEWGYTEDSDIFVPGDNPEKEAIHMAVIGDSTSVDFHFGYLLDMTWSMRTKKHGAWFSDYDDDKNSPYSLVERVSRKRPVRATNYARVVGYITKENYPGWVREKFVKIHSMSQQVDSLLSKKERPELLMIWIGHNDMNWKEAIGDMSWSPEFSESRAKVIAAVYAEQLERIISDFEKRQKNFTIIVMGLVDQRLFLEAREQAKKAHRNGSKAFPHCEGGEKFFESLRPEHHFGMIDLSERVNKNFESLVNIRNRTLSSNVKLIYSNTITNKPLDYKILHVDAWHPSPQGQSLISEAMFPEISAAVEEVLKR